MPPAGVIGARLCFGLSCSDDFGLGWVLGGCYFCTAGRYQADDQVAAVTDDRCASRQDDVADVNGFFERIEDADIDRQ